VNFCPPLSGSVEDAAAARGATVLGAARVRNNDRIARACAVYRATVSKIRAELSRSFSGIAPTTRIVHRGEQTYEMRTIADKRRAVMVLLSDAEWSQWSAGEIARRCHVGDDLVLTMKRERAITLGNESDAPTRVMFTSRHGTTAEMNVQRIGKEKHAWTQRT